MCSLVIINFGMMEMATATFSVRIPEKLKDEVEQFASLTKRSRSYVVKEAVESYMEDRLAYLQELNEAIESIDTQPTYTAENVFSWARTLGTDNETNLPKSHNQ